MIMWNRRLVDSRKKTIDKSLEHCCLAMKTAVDCKYSPIIYEPYIREYVILDKSGIGAAYMTFCCNCGIELPKCLSDEWYAIMEEMFGEDPYGKYKEKAPKEFLTEEWWRKRGL